MARTKHRDIADNTGTFRVRGTQGQIPVVNAEGTLSFADGGVRVSANDTSPGTLQDKLHPTGMKFTITDSGGDETITMESTATIAYSIALS